MSLTALSGSFTQQCIFGTARAAKKTTQEVKHGQTLKHIFLQIVPYSGH